MEELQQGALRKEAGEAICASFGAERVRHDCLVMYGSLFAEAPLIAMSAMPEAAASPGDRNGTKRCDQVYPEDRTSYLQGKTTLEASERDLMRRAESSQRQRSRAVSHQALSSRDCDGLAAKTADEQDRGSNKLVAKEGPLEHSFDK